MGETEARARVSETVATAVLPYSVCSLVLVAVGILHDTVRTMDDQDLQRFSDEPIIAALDDILWRKEGRWKR
jgi:hypothetical protein